MADPKHGFLPITTSMLEAPSPAEKPGALDREWRGRGGDNWKPLPDRGHLAPNTHCLCYDFNITAKFRPEPRWCEVQGLVDERPFLHYDCVNHKAKAFASLGKKVNVTKTWEKQTETLGDVVDFLKGQLPDIQVENLMPIESLIQQARMSCEHKAHGHGRGSWQFLFNGQTFLLSDSNNRKWAVLHPGAKKMKEKWEKNMENHTLGPQAQPNPKPWPPPSVPGASSSSSSVLSSLASEESPSE
uniref:MHC class I-like antigen recognition-like domain-containing protein n=1 Tax=Papio anubis TaxID=9555 RepID=A0A096NW16_PAPAN